MCTPEYFILGKIHAVQKERTSGLISNMPFIYSFSVRLETGIKISKIVTEANVQHNSPETVHRDVDV
jgi:hypothetical protein